MNPDLKKTVPMPVLTDEEAIVLLRERAKQWDEEPTFNEHEETKP